ncbi:MAG TPA: hypothetical protein VJK31_06955, partial [Chthoniobacterales bacterium]|nr:hypothetical protein [Chthoniobacterales bacterium]
MAALLEQTSEQGYPVCDFTLARIDTVRRDIELMLQRTDGISDQLASELPLLIGFPPIPGLAT